MYARDGFRSRALVRWEAVLSGHHNRVFFDSDRISARGPSRMYEPYFENLDGTPAAWVAAADAAASAYLDGRPRRSSQRETTGSQRDAAFWRCPAWMEAPPVCWHGEAFRLALVRYFSQEPVSSPALLERIASSCPEAILFAVRRSRLAVRPASARRRELDALGAVSPEMAELRCVLDIFGDAYRLRLDEVSRCQEPLEALTLFELLLLISLHAFEHVVPVSLAATSRDEASRAEEQAIWRAMHEILWWKLSMSEDAALHLDERAIGLALSRHLAPVLEDARDSRPERVALAELLAATCELNAFLSRSVDAFCFDDGIRFVRRGAVLEIEEVDVALRAAWTRDGRKLERLHAYWLCRALDAFADSPMATQCIGRPENHEANQLAYVRALRTRLQLTEVYGVGTSVTTDAGEPVDLFQALLASELNSAFFQRDILAAYVAHLEACGDWGLALRQLVVDGFLQGQQNRLPLTWSGRAEKVRNLIAWTVTQREPQGSALVAGRILDFWSSDWRMLAERARGGAEKGLRPELFERPYLRFGSTLVQLPWLAGVQNNSTAALNNLRRLGLRRGEYRAETARIEASLGAALAARGFAVVLNWQPPRSASDDAGEVDLICARDEVVLVLEVKSTFLRRSPREAWQHASATLRKAGRQLQRKVAAVQSALAEGAATIVAGEATGAAGMPLAQRLGLAAAGLDVRGWIVDTSIECDHQCFGGFRKVSLEEVLIALRDDARLLHEPLGGHPAPDRQAGPLDSLYPRGFSGERFLEVIESQAVWAGI